MDRHQVSIWEAAMEKRWMQRGDLTFSKGRNKVIHTAGQVGQYSLPSRDNPFLPTCLQQHQGKRDMGQYGKDHFWMLATLWGLGGGWRAAPSALPCPDGAARMWTDMGYFQREARAFFLSFANHIIGKEALRFLCECFWAEKKISLWCQYRCRHPEISTSPGESVFPSCNPNQVNHSYR